jgi:NAD-dependent deacetylase
MPRFQSIVILTGAGISAESGVPTFRASDGLWEGHRIEDVATPEGFARQPERVQDFYNQRRATLDHVEPNAAHLALARLEDALDGTLLVVTQNVDDLHERAGSRHLVHMHGSLRRMVCNRCNSRFDCPPRLDTGMTCQACQRSGGLRPDIVWFGEMPYEMARIEDALARCDLFVSIGTSGNVYPAAGFVSMVRQMRRAHSIEINLEPSQGASWFHEGRHGPATGLVPKLVDELLGAN